MNSQFKIVKVSHGFRDTRQDVGVYDDLSPALDAWCRRIKLFTARRTNYWQKQGIKPNLSVVHDLDCSDADEAVGSIAVVDKTPGAPGVPEFTFELIFPIDKDV